MLESETYYCPRNFPSFPKAAWLKIIRGYTRLAFKCSLFFSKMKAKQIKLALDRPKILYALNICLYGMLWEGGIYYT